MLKDKLKELILQDNPKDIAQFLSPLIEKSDKGIYEHIKNISPKILGNVILELPQGHRQQLLSQISSSQAISTIETLHTDDATDIIQDIEECDKQKAQDILNALKSEHKENIKKLKNFSKEKVGAIMQSEAFSAKPTERIQEIIHNLKYFKKQKNITNIYQVFVIDDNNKFIVSIPLEELLVADVNVRLQDIMHNFVGAHDNVFVNQYDDIQKAVELFDEHKLFTLPVLDDLMRLVGRITSDDVHDIIEESATEQIYHLAGMSEDIDWADKTIKAWRKRAIWLSISLLCAFLSSIIIAIFKDTLKSYIILAILMPIVSAISGNVGLQSLTVAVRQIALGNIKFAYAKEFIKKEFKIACLNSVLFGIVIGMMSIAWADSWRMTFIIGLATSFTLIISGVIGALIPFLMRYMKLDPAAGSSVILTMISDMVCFLSLLSLATWMLM